MKISPVFMKSTGVMLGLIQMFDNMALYTNSVHIRIWRKVWT